MNIRLLTAAVFTMSFALSTSFAPIAGVQAEEIAEDVNVGKHASPEWVEAMAIPDVPENRMSAVTDGILYKLADTQIKWLPDGYEFFYRYTLEVTDRTGLEEASRVSWEFDPSDTNINFSFVRLIRNGKTEDRLSDAAITVLRQEDEMEAGILDGSLTALIELEDVQQGDVIDYAVSGVVKSKLWPGEFFDYVDMGWAVPIGATRYRLIWPKDKKLYFEAFAGAPEPEAKDAGDTLVYEWFALDPEPQPSEDGTPDWSYSWPMVAISSMNDWRQVQEWAAPIYDIDLTLPKDFARKVKAIKRKWKKPEDRMTEALRLVQDQIRYVGIEIGMGSHVPRPPKDVIRRGYGDCKDKTVLLVAVLKKLEIDAWPALVDSEIGPGLPGDLPAPTAFDHVITKVAIGKKVYWLDPTGSHQGGRGDTLVHPPYAYGLPIGSDNNGLEEIEVAVPTAPTVVAIEDFNFPEEGDDLFLLYVKVTYRGSDADNMRYDIAGQSRDDFNRNYLNYYLKNYNGIREVNPVKIQDNLDDNVLNIDATYALDRKVAEKAGVDKKLSLVAWAVRGLFYQPNQANRRTPIEMPYRINRQHQILLTMPGRRPKGGDDMESTFGSAHYKRKITVDQDHLKIDLTVVSNDREADPDQANDALKFATDLGVASNMTFNVSSVNKSLANRFGLDEAEFAPLESRFFEALKAIKDKDHVAALKTLNNLLDDVKEPGAIRSFIQLFRGDTLKKLGRKSSAIAALEEGIAYKTQYASSYFDLASLYRGAEELEKEANVLIKVAQEHPDSVDKLRIRWLGDLNRLTREAGKPELFDEVALAMASAKYKGDNAWGADWIYSRAISALSKKQEKQKAAEFLTHVYDPEELLLMLIDNSYEPLWPAIEERAGSGLREALDRNVEYRKKAFEGNADDLQQLSAYIHALRVAGHMEEAVKLAAPFAEDWNNIETIAGDAFWVVNGYANALNETGKFDEAAAMLKRVASLPISDFPQTINQRINYAILLQRQGKNEAALAYVEELKPDNASAYGKMFIDGVKSCAFYQLDREDEGATVLREMEERQSDNIAAYTSALLCAGELDKTEKVFLDRLEDESMRQDALKRFQRAKVTPHTSAFDREMMTRLRSVLARPNVQKAFTKYGRAIDIDGYDIHWGG